MNKNIGFTLIEVLVAVVVLAIGLLGLAALQATSLANNQSAVNRSQATELAHEITDRVRANRAATSISDGAGGTSSAYDNGEALENTDCLDNTKGCTPAQMAGNDLFEWNRALAAALPSGKGIICLDDTPNDTPAATFDTPKCDGAGSTYAVKIWWDDDRSGAASQQFVTSFRL